MVMFLSRATGLPSVRLDREEVKILICCCCFFTAFHLGVTRRLTPAEWHYGLMAGNAVVMMIIALVKNNEMAFTARVQCGEQHKQKTEASMLILHPLTTLHTHLHALVTYKYVHPLELMRASRLNCHGIELAEKNQFNLSAPKY